mgnify:FL=1
MDKPTYDGSAGRRRQVFISYAREDSTAADTLYEVLNSDPAIKPWLDRRRIQAGDDWEEAIRTAIHESDYIVILMSSQSVGKKGFLQREIREALERALFLPPGQRYVIPVRLDSCESPHRQLRKLQYVDLFPDWTAGVANLSEALGFQLFTHQYVAYGTTHKNNRCDLRPLGEVITQPHQGVVLVNINTLPNLRADLVPAGAMRREGPARDIFLKLWTIAAGDWPRTLYRKDDWLRLDFLLFLSARTLDDNEAIIEITIRQWSLARQLQPYDEDDWRAFSRLVQRPTYANSTRRLTPR